MSPASADREASRICRESAPGHVALLAWLAGDLVGVASYETMGSPGTAEVAFAVADHAHHRGVATLLLEHLVSAGRSTGIANFTAEVLAENSAMLKVFATAGLHASRKQADEVTELAFDLPSGDADPGWETYLEAVEQREGRADVVSPHASTIEGVPCVPSVAALPRPDRPRRAVGTRHHSPARGGAMRRARSEDAPGNHL